MNPKELIALCARCGLVLAVILGFSGPAQASAGEPRLQPGIDYVPGQVLVRFQPERVTAEAQDSLAQFGATQVSRSEFGHELWQVAEGNELALVERLSSTPGVEYAQLNYLYRAEGMPNDPDYGKQWAHVAMKSAAAWDITTGSAEVTIAVIDTGIDENHPDLKSKVVPGADFVSSDGDSVPHDLNGHGTHVAGIAAASGNNGVGVAGLSWGARLMPIQVLDADGIGSSDSVTNGIYWAYQHGAKVINLSLSGSTSDPAIQGAIDGAYAAGTLVVAAMGNDGSSAVRYPAAMNHVLAVGATNRYDTSAYYSNYGAHIDVSAPGGVLVYMHDPGGIYSTMPTYPVDLTTALSPPYSNNYDYLQGTSMASPYAAGLAALVWGMNLSFTPDDVTEIIKSSTDDLGAPGWDMYYGTGRINALKAVQKAASYNAPELSPISNPGGDGDYKVDWLDVPGATGYELEQDSGSAFPSPEKVYSGADSQFQVTGQPGGTWYYRARAVFGGQKGGWSNIQAVDVVPGAPVLENIQSAGAQDEYVIQWQAPPGAQSYRLEEADNSNFSGDSLKVRYQGTKTKYKVTGQPGGTWYYRVRASNAAGSGPWSEEDHILVNSSVVQSPALNPIDNPDRDGKFTISWSAVTGASYILERSRDIYFSSPEKAYEGSKTSITLTGQDGGTWYYRVRAITGGGNSPWSATQAVVVTARILMPFVANRS